VLVLFLCHLYTCGLQALVAAIITATAAVGSTTPVHCKLVAAFLARYTHTHTLLQI
jgi:hypothetical protein